MIGLDGLNPGVKRKLVCSSSKDILHSYLGCVSWHYHHKITGKKLYFG